MGTLVEAGGDVAPAALDAAFAAIGTVEARMSAFRSDSDLSRLNAAPACEPVAVDAHTLEVLRFAARLYALTQGAFDVALGRGRGTPGFDVAAAHAWRTHADVRLTLDGIAKGYAVDLAVEALRIAGARLGWVNAGGDLRVFGDLALPVDRRKGRTLHRLALRERAMATSEYGPRRTVASRSHLHGRRGRLRGSYGASVLARECIVADALAKAVAVAGRDVAAWSRALDAHVIWRA